MNCTCGAPLPDGFFLCAACGDLLATALAEVADVVTVLDAGLSRASLTARYGERVNSSGPLHAPLPINETLYDAKRGLHVALMKAALQIGERITDRSCAGLAAHLTRNLGLVRRQEWAPKFKKDFQEVAKKAYQATQPPGERINVGECGYVHEGWACTSTLMPRRDQDNITCRSCGTVWDVKLRQRDAIGGAWLAVGFPATIIRALSAYGITIKPKHFENWVRLGHLEPVAEQDGRKQYRVNEVWAVARRMEDRRKQMVTKG